jgi:Na+/melibiose symporter-like transporter
VSNFTDKVSKVMHGVFQTTPSDDKVTNLQPKEAMSYSLAGFGQNLICGLITSYLLVYMTDGLLIPAVTVAIIMLGTRVFDALNDPIMGSITDRVRTKWGKCRPFLMWTPIPIALLTTLVFLPLSPVDAQATVTTVTVITIIYVLWSVAYTAIDVPYWALCSSLSSDTNQRSSILTVARLLCTAGSGLISIIVPAFMDNVRKSAYKGLLTNPDFINAAATKDGVIILQDGSLAEGAMKFIPEEMSKMMAQVSSDGFRSMFIWIALVISLLSIPLFFIGFKNTNERFYADTKPKSLGHNLGMLFKNKPLLLIMLSGVLASGRMMFMYSGVFYTTYYMDSSIASTLFTFSVVPGGLIASVLTPYFSRKIGKRNTYIWSHIGGGALLVLSWLIGFLAGGNSWETGNQWQFWIAIVGLVVAGVPQGFANIITYSMIGDTVDWLEYHYHERAEGICFASQTFISKIGMAIGAAVTAFGLNGLGIKPGKIDTYTDAAGNGLWLITILIPGISMIASAIPLFFYTYNEKQQAEYVEANKLWNEAHAEPAALDGDLSAAGAVE